MVDRSFFIHPALLPVVEWVAEKQQGGQAVEGPSRQSGTETPAFAETAGKPGKGGRKRDVGVVKNVGVVKTPQNGCPSSDPTAANAAAMTTSSPAIASGSPPVTPAAAASVLWRNLAWLLSRKRMRIDALDLLSRLPDDVGATL